MSDTSAPNISNLMSNFKKEVKRLSHNELARNFANVYAQLIIAERRVSMLQDELKAVNDKLKVYEASNDNEQKESEQT